MAAPEPDRGCLLIDSENDIWRYETNAWKCQTDFSAHGTWEYINRYFSPVRVFAPLTGGGVGASPAATAEHRTPSAQADQDERPHTPPPPLPRMFELYRHRDISGVSGTGTVAWGVEWPDKTASLRWTGPYPAFANWPDIESMLAVHGHQGATELRWLEP